VVLNLNLADGQNNSEFFGPRARNRAILRHFTLHIQCLAKIPLLFFGTMEKQRKNNGICRSEQPNLSLGTTEFGNAMLAQRRSPH
jgi:hypothetical protein